MQPILLFDVMDTLVADPFFEAMPKFFGLTLKELLEQKHPDSWIEFEKAKISEDEYLASFFLDGRHVDKSGLRRVLWDHYQWLPGMEDLVAELHAAGHEMHAVSNYSIWYRLIEEKLKLSRFMKWTFVSERTGLRKPDEACYRLVCDTLDVTPEQCVFVDDREPNVAAASQFGMRAIKIQDAATLRAALSKLGIEH